MRQLTSHTILYRTNHQTADRSIFRRIKLYEKKCVRQDKKQQNTLFAVDLDDLERKGKAERLQRLHKCKIDQNDTTERWKDVQDIQRRKRIQRIPREEIPTEIHREHTRRHGMDITNDTWPFSLHQPPPHCTTCRIVVVSSSYRRRCSYSFLFIPVSNLIFFHHLFTTSLYHISLPHLLLPHLLFTQLLLPHPLFPHLPSPHLLFSHLLFGIHFLALFSPKEFHPSDGRTFIEGSHFHVALVSRQNDVRT